MEIKNFKKLGQAMKGKNINYINYQVGLENSDLKIMEEILETKIDLKIKDGRMDLFDFLKEINN